MFVFGLEDAPFVIIISLVGENSKIEFVEKADIPFALAYWFFTSSQLVLIFGSVNAPL